MPSPKAKYWILTMPLADYVPWLPPTVVYSKGQLERAPTTGYLHWQFVVAFSQQVRLSALKKLFGDSAHAEPTKSDAANSYVHKEETAIPGTTFELGCLPLKRNSTTDWNVIKKLAMEGDLENPDIPADVFIRYYSSLQRIVKDYCRPLVRGPQRVHVFFGKTGAGKTRRVFDEISGQPFYSKQPTTKWFDGYRGEETIVIDEFRGVIDISHLLRWFDRYPISVELKGSQVPLQSKTWYITSNLSPEEWFPLADQETKKALMRRLTNVVKFE